MDTDVLNETAGYVTVRDAARALPQGQTEGMVILNIGDSQEQNIRVVAVPSNIRGFVNLFVCPSCGRRVRRLFLTDSADAFLCRKCCGIGYKSQTVRAFRKTPYRKRQSATRKTKEPSLVNKSMTVEEVKRLLAESI